MKKVAIIPCAGYGTRVGMKPDESKEMLVLKGESGPIIDYSLSIAEKYGYEPLVISRKEKTDLNEYLRKKEINTFIIEPEGEWMDTVISSSPFWKDINILLLPDARWSDVDNMFSSIELIFNNTKSKLILGMHKITDPKKWCTLSNSGYMEEKSATSKSKWAFGVVAFKKLGFSSGLEFFTGLARHGKTYLPYNTQYVFLESFEDVTRGNYSLTKYK